MKVIRHGNTYKEIACNECGALLSYCKEDVKTWIPSCNSEHWSKLEYIKCPECNNKITLSLYIDGEKQKV